MTGKWRRRNKQQTVRKITTKMENKIYLSDTIIKII